MKTLPSKVRRKLPALLGGLALGVAAGAFAQNAPPGDSYVGLGLRVRPAYEGAATARAQAIPYLRLYGDNLFARTTQGILEGGFQIKPTNGVAFGAQLAYEDGRVTAESAFLKAHHFEDIASGASVGAHAEVDWTIGPMPLNALVRFRQNIRSGLGAQADLLLTAGLFSQGGINAGVFGQLTWSDAKASQSYFGLTPQQAAVTGLPVYSAGAGLRFAAIGILGSVDVSTHWLILWGGSMQRLAGAARNSPIVQDRTNWYAHAGLAYRF
jgi:outer membrane scaffolding protein for murein synthesis (MipA/OmpV family)